MVKDIQIKYKNEQQEWEELYPKTKTRNITDDKGESQEEINENLTAQLAQMTISVKQFGAIGDGLSDDTQAIQQAIDYCLSQKTSTSHTYGEGHKSLYFPAGIYKVSETLNVVNHNGFKITGENQQATQVVFTGTNKSLFNWSNYLNNKIENITFSSGSIDTTGSLPKYTAPTEKTNTCFDYNSTSRGASVSEVNVTYQYFNVVYKSKKSNLNGDNHHHIDCQYHRNSVVWDNTNSQAVIWSFTNCKMYFNDSIFINPAGSLIVRGGDFINPGDFLTVNLFNFGSDSIFDGLRFETFQNIDSTASPRLVNLTDGSGDVFFTNCWQRGGPSLTDKTTGTIRGLWNVELEKCYFDGFWDVDVTTSNNGITSKITFNNCIVAPKIRQTLNSSIGNRPINLEYRNHRTGFTSYVNRLFQGLVGNHQMGVAHQQMADTFYSEGTLNANTKTKVVPVFLVSPYQLQIKNILITWTNNTPTISTITIWSDETKSKKLAEVDTEALSGQYQIIEIPYSQMLNNHTIKAEDSPLLVEISSDGNVGLYKTNITFDYVQVS